MTDERLSRVRADFYGRDPLAGKRALQAAIGEYGTKALAALVPVDAPPSSSIQIEQRLVRLGASAGADGIQHLENVIRRGTWHAGTSATPAFAGLRAFRDAAQEALIGILKSGDIDPQRHAIEALGFLGGEEYAYAIGRFARHGQWTFEDVDSPSKYHLDKFYFYALQALVRMTAALTSAEYIERCLRASMELVTACGEVLGNGRVSEWDILNVQEHFPPRAADPLVATWLNSKSQFFQERALDALGALRLNRTAELLLDTMENETLVRRVRHAAGVSLSQFAGAAAAALLAKRVARIRDAPGFGYAFGALYAHEVDLPPCDDIVDAILDDRQDPDSETVAHMTYSLAWRRDARAERSFSGINSRHVHSRVASAFACARYDATRALDVLRGRDEEAADALEHASILAAQVHAGDTTKLDALHRALIDFPALPLLRPIWKRELLYAFFAAEGEASERGELWCAAAKEKPVRVVSEMRELLRARSAKPDRAATAAVPARPASPIAAAAPAPTLAARDEYDLFISHASEDKQAIAEPLYRALCAAGLRVWFDKAELKLGDRLRRKIDDGLARCRYGVVILSPNFLAKQWPQNELDSLVARETQSGDKAILPVWHDIDAAQLIKVAPTLADRLACRSSEGIDAIVAKILDVVKERG